MVRTFSVMFDISIFSRRMTCIFLENLGKILHIGDPAVLSYSLDLKPRSFKQMLCLRYPSRIDIVGKILAGIPLETCAEIAGAHSIDVRQFFQRKIG